jgi:transketolase
MATKGTDFQRELGQQLRVDSVRTSAAANSGHPTSSMSAADLMAVLLDGHLRLDYQNPANPANDHLVFSKGHASPLYYAILKAAGSIDDDEFLTFRKLNSRLEGHPTPRIPPTDVATGSLGQGLPISVGIAMAGRSLDKLPYRVWCLCGDSEMAEGSMWEAFQHAGWEGLDNLIAIIDVNRLGQTRETMLGWDTAAYAERIRAFGWHAIEIDGHDVEQIEAAYTEAEQTKGKPTAIIARTKKGKGVEAVEDLPGKHGKPLDDPEAAIAELGGERDLEVEVAKPEAGEPSTFDTSGGELPSWELGESVATRKAYGEVLAALGNIDPYVVALDGEVSNSTHSEDFREAHPDRYFEMFIAEQQLVSAAVGMQVQHRWKPFVSTFSAFFSRAYDFIRMAAISRADIRLVGSHAGVSIGEDGPSQMALEDIASLRAIHSSTVLHPSDANQAAKLIAAMADLEGISFLRTLRGKTPVRTPADEDVRVGGSRIVAGADAEDVAIVACGITVDEAVRAAETLEAEGIKARVIDCYSIKPIDAETLKAASRECGAIVTVEDHWPEGGLGDAVLEALADADDRAPVTKLAVREMPVSGSPEELLHAAGIDAEAIASAARSVVGARA